MAKQKKPEEQAPGSPAWMATFSDLMNLLLCFFVLLFAMSSVDEEKFEELANSLSSRLNIFSGGRTSIGEGQLISLGTAQLNNMDEYFSSMGKTSEETGEVIEDPKQAVEEAVKEENWSQTEEMYDNISSMTGKYNLDKYVDIGVDVDGGRYITLEVSGNFLYKSGKAELTEEAIPIFSKIGDILKHYEGYRIAIIGHTDNIPVSSGGRYADNMELSSARASEAAKYLIEKKGQDPKFIEWTGRGEYDPVADNSTEDGRAQNRRIEIRIYNSLNSD